MFKSIPGYEDYLINYSGVVIDRRTEEVMRASADNVGYMYVNLDGHMEYVHDLMAKTFFQQPYIIHADGDPMNNHISNIQYSVTPEKIPNAVINRSHRKYSKPTFYYEVYNEKTGDAVTCKGRGEVAKLIQYEEISLKNIIGNGRIITLGPYKGYQIRRLERI